MRNMVVGSVYVISLCAFAFNVAAAEPTVYCDISEEAQEAAVSFDGVNAFAGLMFQHIISQAGTINIPGETKNSFNKVGATFGVGYSKALRKGFLVGVEAGVDVARKGKKEAGWNDLNSAYSQEAQKKYAAGNKSGKLETDAITPSFKLTAGYALPKYQLALFLKVGVSKLKSTYNYSHNGANVSSVNLSKFVPSIGVGIERKCNSKLGVAVEASISQKKSGIDMQDGVSHKIRLGRTDLKVMGIYSVSSQK